MSRPGGAACARCGVVAAYDDMVRRKNRKGRSVWLHRECAAAWERLKVRR